MKKISLIIYLGLSIQSLGQADTAMINRENRLVTLLNDLRSAENDDDKNTKNFVFKEYLAETLKKEGAFTYPFSKLTTVGFIDSPDGELRIINWNIEQADQSQKYYCFLLHKNSKKKTFELSELTDNSFMLPPRPDGILEASDWYGALYYKIIPIDKGSKTIYTLLGWDGNNSMSTIKLIDALYFSGDNPKLGSPIFKTADATYKRMFYEHSKKAVMSLKFEQEYERIIFDHLSPETPNLAGFYAFYVPDLSYDAFVLEGNKWVLKEDVVGVNKGDKETNEVIVKNERTGKLEKKEIKNKWETPEDPNAPGGGNEHIAVTPDQDEQNPNATSKELDKKVNKKDKRDPGNLNSTLGTNKPKRKRRP